jgi:hypothetical protein
MPAEKANGYSQRIPSIGLAFSWAPLFSVLENGLWIATLDLT